MVRREVRVPSPHSLNWYLARGVRGGEGESGEGCQCFTLFAWHFQLINICKLLCNKIRMTKIKKQYKIKIKRPKYKI